MIGISLPTGALARPSVASALQKDPTVLFFHIPKTGGSTLLAHMEKQYSPEELYVVMRPSPEEAARRYREMPTEERLAYQAISGHMAMEFEEAVPGDVRRITLLRDPVDRVVSEYYYVLETPKHPKHAEIHGSGLSLRTVVERGVLEEADNGQTRILSGIGQKQTPYGMCSDDLFHKAMRNLEGFEVVGTTSRLPELLHVLNRRFGWRGWRQRRKNVTRNRPRVRDINPSTLELIEELNRFDAELYRVAQQRFEETVGAMGAGFRLHTRMFSRLNRGLDRIYHWKVQLVG